jgi:hypothetical protein
VEKFIIKNYSRFYHNFLIESDNGRSSLRIANTFSLEVPSIELAAIDNNIRLHLKPKMPLIYHSADSIALVIINIVLCGFVCFGKFVKGIVVIPL